MRHLLGLAAVVAAVLALAAWQWRQDAADAPPALTVLDPDAITRIALSLPEAATEHYEKRAGHWWRTDGMPARADDARVRMLAEIAATPVGRWRAAAEFTPAKIGLTPPAAVLELDGQRLEFGARLATAPGRYVRVGTRIALVGERAMPQSPATAATGLR